MLDMPAMVWPGDPTAWREETRSLLHRGELSVDPYIGATKFDASNQPGQYFVQNTRNGLWYSKYGIVNSLMSFPPMLLQQIVHRDTAEPYGAFDPLIYNLWNLVLSVLLAAVLMAISGLYTQRLVTRIAFVATVLYGTYLWIYLRAQSSEIYQTLFYSAAYLFLARWIRQTQQPGASRLSLMLIHLVWLFVCILSLTRILYLLLIPLYGLVAMWALIWLGHRSGWRAAMRLWPHVLLPPLAIVAVCGLVNFIKFGSPFLSGYHQWRPELHLPTGPMWDGLHGLLLRPRFSILLYFPLFPISLVAVWHFARRFPLESAAAMGSFVLFVLALSKIPTWPGEWTYGPRYILFALPIAALPFILLIEWTIDRIRRAPMMAWPALVAITAVLLYSSYLQYRVNGLDFFAFYYLRPHDLSESDARYFEDRPVGITVDAIERHGDDLTVFPWFVNMTQHQPPAAVARYRQIVKIVLSRRNYYWWPGDDPNWAQPHGR